jgi:hypothetical protein
VEVSGKLGTNKELLTAENAKKIRGVRKEDLNLGVGGL